MASKTFIKDEIVIGAAQANDYLYVVANGSVMASSPGVKLNLGKGDVIGACELGYESHFISYLVSEDCSVLEYPADINELYPVLLKKGDFSAYLFKSTIKQLNEMASQYAANLSEAAFCYDKISTLYKQYRTYCSQLGVFFIKIDGIETMEAFEEPVEVSRYLSEYYQEMYRIVKDGRNVSPEFMYNFLLKAGKDARAITLVAKKVFAYLAGVGNYFLDETKNDLFAAFTDLYFDTESDKVIHDEIAIIIGELESFMDNKPYINPNRYTDRVNDFRRRREISEAPEPISEDDKGLYNDVKDSLNQILDFSEIDGNEAEDFKGLLFAYKNLSDMNSTADSARHLRLDITNMFLKIYESIALKTLSNRECPKVIKMFLHFGYMDEGLCTPSDLRFMYNHCEGDFANPEVGVFTFWQWLLEIYKGNRLPSRNEFDVDYETFVHEQKVKNQITAAQETAALKDRVSMVKYEIRNLFPVGNKVTFGHITIYCPVFSSHNVVRKLQDSLITTSALRKRIDEIREVDYQLFYRESVYSNEKLGINSEYVNTEVLPDFILMPNAGSRALMWQEIQGRVRTTHARMILPVFDMEDYKTQILHLCGDYRWEMCKRIQGPRYNDVTDPSLTSEFFDYVQFYRKNHDLSPEAKERVKMNLSKAKNSFKEMFVMDYMLYVAYEVGGSPRLNKVSREILMKYCPFPSETRRALAANPTFKDNIERYEMKLSAKIKRAENLVNKIQNAGAKVPDVIYSELEYLKK